MAFLLRWLVPLEKFTLTAAGFASWVIEIVVAGEDCVKYDGSATLVAVTRHVPALVDMRSLPETAQPTAVPFVATYVTAPVPDPPLVASSNGTFTCPEMLVIMSGDCAI
jgi:hypothetical protein